VIDDSVGGGFFKNSFASPKNSKPENVVKVDFFAKQLMYSQYTQIWVVWLVPMEMEKLSLEHLLNNSTLHQVAKQGWADTHVP
jgi:hypothetical protein